MPRYWMPGYKPYYYCWADNPKQARECMDAWFGLLDKEPNYQHSICLAINQFHDNKKWAKDAHDVEPDFRTNKDA